MIDYEIPKPYALYLGKAESVLEAKTSVAIAKWRPEDVVGEVAHPDGKLSLGIKRMSNKQAAESGAKTLIIGLANSGGILSKDWLNDIEDALNCGMNVAAGLHQRLVDNPRLARIAEENNCRLYDIRHSDAIQLKVGNGKPRTGKRLLTVGTDCSVGKMYTTLSIEHALKRHGVNATFRATGQTGIFIAGTGICIDAVGADFISGAVEGLSPDNDDEHWDIIEGQGSLFNPSFAGVSLGLIHGAQADLLVMCHQLGREYIKDLQGYKVPSLETCIAANLQHACLTNPDPRLAAISLNTSNLESKSQALERIEEIAARFQVPCFDPMLTGVESILEVPEFNRTALKP